MNDIIYNGHETYRIVLNTDGKFNLWVSTKENIRDKKYLNLSFDECIKQIIKVHNKNE